MQVEFLKVTGVEIKKSEKVGCNFKVVTYRGFKLIGDREFPTRLSGVRVLWPKHEITLKDGSKAVIKADIDYDTVAAGEVTLGGVVSLDTTDYTIGNNVVNTWKGVIFEGENPMVVAARQLLQNDAKVFIDKAAGELFEYKVRTVADNKAKEEKASDNQKPADDEKAGDKEPVITGEKAEDDPF